LEAHYGNQFCGQTSVLQSPPRFLGERVRESEAITQKVLSPPRFEVVQLLS